MPSDPAAAAPISSTDPARLAILRYPHPVLRRRAEPIASPGDRVADNVRAVAERMIELMHEAPGIGLAAPQVGLPWRLFVANWTGNAGDDHVFINPELADPTRDTEPRDEGCLSLPEITAEITRPAGVTVRATGLDGQRFEMTDHGSLAARVWQHEFDHLEGVLILDRMTRIDRMANRKAIRQLETGGG